MNPAPKLRTRDLCRWLWHRAGGTVFLCTTCLSFRTRMLYRARRHAKVCIPKTRHERRRSRQTIAKGGLAL